MVGTAVLSNARPVKDLDGNQHLALSAIRVVKGVSAYMIDQSICKYVVVRMQLRKRKALLLRQRSLRGHRDFNFLYPVACDRCCADEQ